MFLLLFWWCSGLAKCCAEVLSNRVGLRKRVLGGVVDKCLRRVLGFNVGEKVGHYVPV